MAGGLTFATGLTLLVTPCMLVLGARFEPAFKPLDSADAELLDIPDEFNAALRKKQAEQADLASRT